MQVFPSILLCVVFAHRILNTYSSPVHLSSVCVCVERDTHTDRDKAQEPISFSFIVAL